MFEISAHYTMLELHIAIVYFVEWKISFLCERSSLLCACVCLLLACEREKNKNQRQRQQCVSSRWVAYL